MPRLPVPSLCPSTPGGVRVPRYGVRVYAKEPITGLALDSTSVMVRIENSGIATCSLFSCPSEKS